MPQTEPLFHYLDNEGFLADLAVLASSIQSDAWQPDFVIGIGRGGLVPAVYLSHKLDLPMLSIDHSSKVDDFADELLAKVAKKSAAGTRLLFIDDINDSGGTIEYIRQLLVRHGCKIEHLRFAVVINNTSSKAVVDYWAQIIDRTQDKRWFVFPWEAVGAASTIREEALSVPERLA